MTFYCRTNDLHDHPRSAFEESAAIDDMYDSETIRHTAWVDISRRLRN